MPRSSLFTERLLPERIYHVYNQTNNKEALFITSANQIRFLRNLEKYVAPFVDIFAFNLLTNHFHLILEVLPKELFLRNASRYYIDDLPRACKALVLADEENMDLILENRFKAMLSGYSTYFNIRNKRKGNFFHRPFCRKRIHSMDYFRKAVYYVHANSVKHGMHQDMLDHDWTSYHQVLIRDQSLLALDKMFEYFNGEKEFIKYHERGRIIEEHEAYIIEEETVFRYNHEEGESERGVTLAG
jgi:REP element-mobilizing transposase RayT